MISAKKISDNFSRGTAAYDRMASCQKHVAEKLSAMIFKQVQAPGAGVKILELGCGTGFLTEKLMEKFPACEFTITDLSGKMLSRCVEKTSAIAVRKKEFILCDFDKSIPDGGFDMVVSSMAFQWSSGLERLVSSIYSRLNPDGRIFFSMLIEPTFATLRETFLELKIPYPGPQFNSDSQVRGIFSAFSGKHFHAETFKERYKDTASFLRHLNSIGAGNPTCRGVLPGRLRNIIEMHNSKHSASNFIEAEYRILYGALKK
ncbi:MAG: hypothetical protein A2X45_21380 [Lentisphaerae bacterium GWF2_50_93]|nr:MAG: hypothetical protein A2X45_21380 [Lentisphaerae bacterium GWF2_50_93]